MAMIRTLIIAEAGVNHNGDLDLACQLVEAAAEAGADIVKFQTFRAETLVTQSASKADYQKQTTSGTESQFEMIRRLELTPSMHEVLIDRCRKSGIGFLSAAFDIESLDYLVSLGLDRFKIPSGELTNLPYLRHAAGYGLPIILSTGMGTLGEVESALDIIEKAGTPREKITVLHCNTEYPTPMCDVNLRAMLTIRDAFEVAVGYSDHTNGIEVPIAAVALGATVIEKHFTLDRNLPGPDHPASLEPDELSAMVSAIRNVEVALGGARKLPSASEAKNRSVARKSIVAATKIRSGEVFSLKNITVKRPGTGISPMRWDEMVGTVAKRDYEPDECIEP